MTTPKAGVIRLEELSLTDNQTSVKKAAPRYPNGYIELSSIDAATWAKRFPKETNYYSALQFCTRYRLAASFAGIKLKDFVRDDTGRAYGSVFQVFLCYTGYELMLKSMAKEESTALNAFSTKHGGKTVMQKIENVPKHRDFLIRLRDAHDLPRGRTMIKAIDDYLNAPGRFTAVQFAKAVRNAFAHGRLASAPGSVGPRNVISICEILSAHLLDIMNKEFGHFMSQP